MKKSVSVFDIHSNNFKLVVMLILAYTVLCITSKGAFFTLGQAKLVAYLFPEMGLMALGVMLCMIAGGIDLTVVAVADLTGILGCMLLKKLMPENANVFIQIVVLIIAVFITIILGALCGMFNGFLIAVVGIPAMVATLGAGDIILGVAVGITNGSSVKDLPPILNQIVSHRIMDLIPVTTIVFAICALIISHIMNKTTLGFKIYMIGSNKFASKYSGVDNKKVLITTHMISGMLAAVSGLLMCGHFNSARSDFGKSYLTPAILICVLAGINPNGGQGKVSGMVLAVVILQMLSSGFALFQNISDYYKNLIWGLVLIGVMIVNVISERKRKAT